jgi:phosphate transport system permease protein
MLFRPCQTRVLRAFLFTLCLSLLGISLTLLGILVWETVGFFTHVNPFEFFLGLVWNPTVTDSGECLFFGSVPLICGTLLITFVTLCVAAPLGIGGAIYVAEYLSPRNRRRVKGILEFLSGIPTIVYGVTAALTIAPLLNGWGQWLGLEISFESAVVSGLVMGLMNFPFVVSLSDEILRAIPAYVRSSGLALGATQSEVIRKLVLPASIPGLTAVITLAVARTIGETMIVVMATGLSAQLTLNPFAPATTLTAQLTSLITGDQSPGSPKTQAAFALGLLLFAVTFVLNLMATRVVRKYKVRYA